MLAGEAFIKTVRDSGSAVPIMIWCANAYPHVVPFVRKYPQLRVTKKIEVVEAFMKMSSDEVLNQLQERVKEEFHDVSKLAHSSLAKSASSAPLASPPTSVPPTAPVANAAPDPSAASAEESLLRELVRLRAENLRLIKQQQDTAKTAAGGPGGPIE